MYSGPKKDLPVMNNIDYVLKGYDIYFGNPKTLGANTIDPGFRAPIFKATYIKQQETGDRRYKTPDGVNIVPCHQCEFDFQTSTISGENSYQRSLDMKVFILNSAR